MVGMGSDEVRCLREVGDCVACYYVVCLGGLTKCIMSASSDYKNTDEYITTMRIGDNISSMVRKLNSNQTDIYFCSEDTLWNPHDWFEHFILYTAYKADEILGEDKKIAFLAESRSHIIQIIEDTNRFIEFCDKCKKYNFSGELSRIDALIYMGKIELEAKLLVSQLATNENTNQLNEHLKINNTFINSVFKWTLVLTIVSVAISAWSLHYASTTNSREQRKENREARILETDSLLQLKNLEMNSLKKANDSLSKLLVSYTPKPLDTNHKNESYRR